MGPATPGDRHLVYLAELTYDTTVVSLEHFPIATGYIAGYAEKQFPGRFDYRIFKFAEPLLDAIDRDPPAILGLGRFSWNETLGLLVAEHYRKRVPDGLLVFGGCSFPPDPDGQRDFFLAHPAADLFVTFDGEFGFAEVLRRYLREDGDRRQILASEPIDGVVFLDRAKNELRTGNTLPRPADLDTIPSPYLSGRLDSFFDDLRLTPMVQSTRGCPFPCGYCWAGNAYNSCVRHFSPARVAAELDYIAARRRDTGNRLLTLADSNFGMYTHDEAVGEKIVSLQKECGFPSSFYSPCGKDNKDRVLGIIRRIKNAAAIVSVQSTDPVIQTNVHRKPIDLNSYRQIVHQFKSLNIPVETEIITGLPGETVQTHLQTLRDIISLGVDEIHPFTLMFLQGTDLDTPQSQARYGWDKRYRIIPRNFGKIRGRICFEIETVGVGSNTFSFDDYLYCRGLHGALRIVFNHALFIEFSTYLLQAGADIFDFCLDFYKLARELPDAAGDQMRAFLREARDEVWSSRGELEAFYRRTENYEKLLSGEQGENLLGKYKTITVTDNFDPWCDFYHRRTLAAVAAKHPGAADRIAAELGDIRTHVLAKASGILDVPNQNAEPVIVSLAHDVFAWIGEHFSRPLSDYRLAAPRTARYQISPEGQTYLQDLIRCHAGRKASLWKAFSSRYYLPEFFRVGAFVR
ncbi:MAG: radical SAM protein [Phycisphaerae bacterium]|nr:radical SAM protein [Phycisphaerae bacterium]